MKRWLPLILFAGALVLLGVGLGMNPRDLPSALVGKPVPQFSLPDLMQADKQVTENDFKDKVWVLNVWASWCVSCQAEHKLLIDWKRPEGVDLVGLNYKDESKAARAWLVDMGGNPYDRIAVDMKGLMGIDLGVYGVPETFIIDKQGQIVQRFTGALTAEVVETRLKPMIDQALAQP